MKDNIILTTLKKKLSEITKKREKLYNDMQYNYYADICEIRKNFRDILNKYGGNSEEAKDFAFKYTDKEKELMKKAQNQIDNSDKWLEKIIEYDNDIVDLSNEIACREVRK